MTEQRTRADRNNNPICFSIGMAERAKLRSGVDYSSNGDDYATAHVLGDDPIEIAVRVLDPNESFVPISNRWVI